MKFGMGLLDLHGKDHTFESRLCCLQFWQNNRCLISRNNTKTLSSLDLKYAQFILFNRTCKHLKNLYWTSIRWNHHLNCYCYQALGKNINVLLKFALWPREKKETFFFVLRQNCSDREIAWTQKNGENFNIPLSSLDNSSFSLHFFRALIVSIFILQCVSGI